MAALQEDLARLQHAWSPAASRAFCWTDARDPSIAAVMQECSAGLDPARDLDAPLGRLWTHYRDWAARQCAMRGVDRRHIRDLSEDFAADVLFGVASHNPDAARHPLGVGGYRQHPEWAPLSSGVLRGRLAGMLASSLGAQAHEVAGGSLDGNEDEDDDDPSGATSYTAVERVQVATQADEREEEGRVALRMSANAEPWRALQRHARALVAAEGGLRYETLVAHGPWDRPDGSVWPEAREPAGLDAAARQRLHRVRVQYFPRALAGAWRKGALPVVFAAALLSDPRNTAPAAAFLALFHGRAVRARIDGGRDMLQDVAANLGPHVVFEAACEAAWYIPEVPEEDA